MTKRITVSEFLTNEEIALVQTIWQNDRSNFHKRVKKEIIAPNMNRIDRDLGQANDPDYLVYLLEYLCGRAWP